MNGDYCVYKFLWRSADKNIGCFHSEKGSTFAAYSFLFHEAIILKLKRFYLFQVKGNTLSPFDQMKYYLIHLHLFIKLLKMPHVHVPSMKQYDPGPLSGSTTRAWEFTFQWNGFKSTGKLLILGNVVTDAAVKCYDENSNMYRSP